MASVSSSPAAAAVAAPSPLPQPVPTPSDAGALGRLPTAVLFQLAQDFLTDDDAQAAARASWQLLRVLKQYRIKQPLGFGALKRPLRCASLPVGLRAVLRELLSDAELEARVFRFRFGVASTLCIDAEASELPDLAARLAALPLSVRHIRVLREVWNRSAWERRNTRPDPHACRRCADLSNPPSPEPLSPSHLGVLATALPAHILSLIFDTTGQNYDDEEHHASEMMPPVGEWSLPRGLTTLRLPLFVPLGGGDGGGDEEGEDIGDEEQEECTPSRFSRGGVLPNFEAILMGKQTGVAPVAASSSASDARRSSFPPPSLVHLSLSGARSSSLSWLRLPETLRSLRFGANFSCPPSEWPQLPEGLEEIVLPSVYPHPLASLRARLPRSLRRLHVQYMQPVAYHYGYGPAAANVPSHLLEGATRTSWPPALTALTLAEPPPQLLQRLQQLQQQRQSQSLSASKFGAMAAAPQHPLATSLFELDLHVLPPSLRWLRIHHSHVLLSSVAMMPLPIDLLPHLCVLQVDGVLPDPAKAREAAAGVKVNPAQYLAGMMQGLQPSSIPAVSPDTFEGNAACLAELTRRVDAVRQAKLKSEQQKAANQARQEEYQREQQKRAAAHAFVQAQAAAKVAEQEAIKKSAAAGLLAVAGVPAAKPVAAAAAAVALQPFVPATLAAAQSSSLFPAFGSAFGAAPIATGQAFGSKPAVAPAPAPAPELTAADIAAAAEEVARAAAYAAVEVHCPLRYTSSATLEGEYDVLLLRPATGVLVAKSLVLQLLKVTSPHYVAQHSNSQWYVWCWWGEAQSYITRVQHHYYPQQPQPGQGPPPGRLRSFKTREEAEAYFLTMFRRKTGVDWVWRDQPAAWQQRSGSYALCAREAAAFERFTLRGDVGLYRPVPHFESCQPVALLSLLRAMFSSRRLATLLAAVQIDLVRLPLSSLTADLLARGHQILLHIEHGVVFASHPLTRPFLHPGMDIFAAQGQQAQALFGYRGVELNFQQLSTQFAQMIPPPNPNPQAHLYAHHQAPLQTMAAVRSARQQLALLDDLLVLQRVVRTTSSGGGPTAQALADDVLAYVDEEVTLDSDDEAEADDEPANAEAAAVGFGASQPTAAASSSVFAPAQPTLSTAASMAFGSFGAQSAFLPAAMPTGFGQQPAQASAVAVAAPGPTAAEKRAHVERRRAQRQALIKGASSALSNPLLLAYGSLACELRVLDASCDSPTPGFAGLLHKAVANSIQAARSNLHAQRHRILAVSPYQALSPAHSWPSIAHTFMIHRREGGSEQTSASSAALAATGTSSSSLSLDASPESPAASCTQWLWLMRSVALVQLPSILEFGLDLAKHGRDLPGLGRVLCFSPSFADAVSSTAGLFAEQCQVTDQTSMAALLVEVDLRAKPTVRNVPFAWPSRLQELPPHYQTFGGAIAQPPQQQPQLAQLALGAHESAIMPSRATTQPGPGDVLPADDNTVDAAASWRCPVTGQASRLLLCAHTVQPAADDAAASATQSARLEQASSSSSSQASSAFPTSAAFSFAGSFGAPASVGASSFGQPQSSSPFASQASSSVAAAPAAQENVSPFVFPMLSVAHAQQCKVRAVAWLKAPEASPEGSQ